MWHLQQKVKNWEWALSNPVMGNYDEYFLVSYFQLERVV